MIPIKFRFLLLVNALSYAGCSASTNSQIAAIYGYKSSHDNKAIAEEAIDLANKTFDSTVPFRFVAAWKPSRFEGRESIQVVLITRQKAEKLSMCFVPRGGRIVFIVTDDLPFLTRILAGGYKNATERPTSELLAICLLHEAGHLFLRHSDGAALDTAEQPEFNDLDTTSKAREEAADAFAAEQIGSGFKAPFSERFDAASTLYLNIPGICWSLVGHQAIDNFGKKILRPEEVYFDEGFSHPNLQLRFLRINAAIHPSESTRQELAEFLSRRGRIAARSYSLNPTTTNATSTQPSTRSSYHLLP